MSKEFIKIKNGCVEKSCTKMDSEDEEEVGRLKNRAARMKKAKQV